MFLTCMRAAGNGSAERAVYGRQFSSVVRVSYCSYPFIIARVSLVSW